MKISPSGWCKHPSGINSYIIFSNSWRRRLSCSKEEKGIESTFDISVIPISFKYFFVLLEIGLY